MCQFKYKKNILKSVDESAFSNLVDDRDIYWL